jgi:hypothetical protein
MIEVSCALIKPSTARLAASFPFSDVIERRQQKIVMTEISKGDFYEKLVLKTH